ncbi:RNA polymerase recycling motor ATPase HelR [Saccharopolyspora flava]|uniref:RNA polymerase recycling motor ATPase HelR n=1 Tax=Saccharopolyspora flava TaxID=95161 RepID=UPI001FE789EC|nr:RNA polymerase recycling motor ATPase HelR [Saccharopolyspora flava]
MSEHDEELRSERAHVAGLYARLDAERARAETRYQRALGDTATSPMERDVEVRAQARELQRLNVADHGLCFGRLDADDGERRYIGRIGLFDEADDHRPLLLDWRAPAARPFYTATAAHPESMRRRRQLHSRGREITGFTDEVLGCPDGDTAGDAALLAAVNAPRGEGMRDIVATIQAEQDRIIRLDHPGVLVIEGGPGTGKTVVALHRVAYLLYTQRERMERSGVLVVGPNPQFLNHIGRVLPSLGESDVVFATTGDLLPGLRVTAEDAPEIAEFKGSLTILDVLRAAIADRQRLPEQPWEIELEDVSVRIDAATAEWAREEARDSGLPHNEARAVFVDVVGYVLTERATARIGRGWLTREDEAWGSIREEVRAELAEHRGLREAIDALWPELTPQQLLADLYTSPERLRAVGAEALLRDEGEAWTVSDVPLLDELVDLLGEVKTPSAEEDSDYAAGVLEILQVERHDLMDDEDHLLAQDLLDASDLAERFVEHDTRDLAERAAADRDWTYRHVVVDEAQELSEMDWRVLMRRCPSRSFTVVGDLAQRRSAAGARTWAAMLDRYVPGRWAYRELTVNYRTPAEIMELAAGLLAEFAPGVAAPASVRSTGVEPWFRQVDASEMSCAVEEFTSEESGCEGTSVVIGPPGTPGAVTPTDTKGLEFDAVLLVEPAEILATPRGAADLYVALTRATQRLGILHTTPLPDVLRPREE